MTVIGLDWHAETQDFVQFSALLLPEWLAGSRIWWPQSANPSLASLLPSVLLENMRIICGLLTQPWKSEDLWTYARALGQMVVCVWYVWPEKCVCNCAGQQRIARGHWQEHGPWVGSLGWTSFFIAYLNNSPNLLNPQFLHLWDRHTKSHLFHKVIVRYNLD